MSDATPRSNRSHEQSTSKASGLLSDPAQAEMRALAAQRAKDLDRLRALTMERDLLRFELAERNAAEARLLSKKRDRGYLADDDEDEVGRAPPIDGWLLKAGVIRARLRDETPIGKSLLGTILAAAALRFAKKAARERHYATAEVFYQVILLLAPRRFIWRQTGNMLAGQGLYAAAVECFDRAIQADEHDAAAWHARAMALRNAGERDEAVESFRRAGQIDPALAQPTKR